MPLVVPFRFSAHHFPHLCPHGKRKRGISNLCAPGIPGKQLSRCQKIRNQVAPRGWRDFWGFNFCWPKKSVALEREGWWRMNLMFHLCFFLKKENIAGGGLKIYSGWMLLDVCLGGVYCEGGEVCVVFSSGCMKEGPGKACMLLLYMYEREKIHHDILSWHIGCGACRGSLSMIQVHDILFEERPTYSLHFRCRPLVRAVPKVCSKACWLRWLLKIHN